jgi:cbb3-type cytochrome oxidase cytochrome c subunit
MVAEMTSPTRRTGIAAAILVAGVYAYFLLFSQFAFLEIVQHAGFGEMRIKAVLGMMAVGGIAGAYCAQRDQGIRLLRMGLVGCMIAAILSMMVHDLWSLGFASLLMGFSLGSVTVCLAALLPQWLPREKGCWYVGIGTGLGYALCNVPVVFLATPLQQCGIAAVFALVAFGASWLVRDVAPLKREVSKAPGNHRAVWTVLVFLAFVWMDSGAFYVIQHAPDLKKATWGAEKLWINAGLHFFAAVLAGWMLARGQFRLLQCAAAIILGAAALWVNDVSTRVVAGYFYPVAVSFYSTALVCWPGLLSGKTQAWQRAAWVFAIAGWIGSGLGIGMVENLHRVPVWFVIVACGVILLGLFGGVKKGAWVMILALVGFFLLENHSPPAPATTAVERGRQVYVAEGCIHCHSQYIRPQSMDEALWGEAKKPGDALQQRPVLIGNRRQGPDLTHIAGRRSATWLRVHFLAPRDLVPDSVMPSYAHLFEDGRGADLIAYLTRDIADDITAVQQLSQAWQPASVAQGDVVLGKRLYSQHCAVCHGHDGRGQGMLAAQLTKSPANLAEGPWMWSAKRDGESEAVSIARVVRFGIPGTDMPGHETWTPEQWQAVTSYLLQWRGDK